MSFEPKQYVNMSEAARLIGHSVSWLQHYIRTGRAPAYEEVSGRKIFKRDEIMGWEWVQLKRGRPKKL